RAHGEGVATPDHLLYLCTTSSSCPATEPEEIPGDALPDPGISAEQRDGEGILMVIPDSGFLPGADKEHTWLRDVAGEPENPIGGDPPRPPSPPAAPSGSARPPARAPARRRG